MFRRDAGNHCTPEDHNSYRRGEEICDGQTMVKWNIAGE
jgi:hypothetical protein